MIKKIAYLGVASLLTLAIVSCEKDFTEVGSTIIDNSKFTTEELIFDVDITQANLNAVNAGNTEIANLGEYLLGIYKKPNAKTLKAGIVSQLIVPTLRATPSLKEGESLSTPILDEVILKIPVNAVFKGKINQEITVSGETKTVKVPDYRIDSLLGNKNAEFKINVYKSGAFLTDLDPANPAKKNIYLSNHSYLKQGGKLNPISTISYENIEKDTTYIFDRNLSNGSTYKDTLKVENKKQAIPFIAIKLDKNLLKTEVFDKLINSELTQENFNETFKGIIIEVEGTDGALIPLNLALAGNPLKPSIDFIYTRTVLKNSAPVVKDDGSVKTVESNSSFYFGGVRNSTYTMEGSTSIANSVVLQGTAGSNAVIKILNQDTNNNGLTDLEELRKNKIIINDARLVIDINTLADTTETPQRLFLYKKETNNTGDVISAHLSDLLQEGTNSFDGVLRVTNEKPDYYSFGVRAHITDIIKGRTSNSELILRVFNTGDFPSKTTGLSIKPYNWNARSVPLLINSTQQGTIRGAKLKISYTKEK